jgi:ubiquinone/menaquinone biosynthesis C-methylase UbiE
MSSFAPSGDLEATRAYYDEFSARYDDHRGGRTPNGYHDLVDAMEVDFCARYGTNSDILEVGCGTGLLLERLATFARSARGIDLSPGMLAHAKARGLEVSVGSATELPFANASFDLTCSFKVLPHVQDIKRALAEMARVTRPGGTVIAEFYNPMSFRGLAKRIGPAGKISDRSTEDAVFTRFDTLWSAERYLPRELYVVASRGVRIVTPAAVAMKVPGLGSLLTRAEWALCDSPLRVFAGFVILAMQKAL